MNASLKLGIFGLAVATVSAAVGYIGGFQQAWRLSLMAEAAIADAKLRGERSEDLHSRRQVVDSMVARFGR